MKVNETGVLGESSVYFHTPSLTAQQLYFTLSCTGRYICSSNYAVSRPSSDSFLLLYVVRGKGYCYLGEQRAELRTGALAILDCYQMHRYGTDTSWEILWVHFDGRMARDYFDAIAASGRQIIMPKNGYHASRGLEKIHRMLSINKRVNEAVISKNIVSVLTEFMVCEQPREDNTDQSARIEETLSFINENIDQPLTLETLAQHASLSTFYFSRVFKKETGYAPREYLIMTRMNAARFYLRTTNLSLKEITFRCGYGSESTFCTMFKRITGMTPLEYRNQP